MPKLGEGEEEKEATASGQTNPRRLNDADLEDILSRHALWLESVGKKGERGP